MFFTLLSRKSKTQAQTRTLIVRSSRPEVFCGKGVLRNFAKFTGKHLCQSLFFNKVVDLRPAILIKKTLDTGDFL